MTLSRYKNRKERGLGVGGGVRKARYDRRGKQVGCSLLATESQEIS